MNKKRKSCPVNQREFLVIENFNENDKSSFDGTETVRGLNKFTKKFFSENQIVVLSTSKSFQGKTFVVPFIDKGEKRYWISDPLRKERLNKEKLERQKYLIEQDRLKKEKINKSFEYDFDGIYIGDGMFLVNEENYEKVMKKKPLKSNSIRNYNMAIVDSELYKINLSNIIDVENINTICNIQIKTKKQD